MEQIVRIRRLIDDNMAEVVCACQSPYPGGCHKCSNCAATQETMVFQAENPVGAKAGELVTIRSSGGLVIKAAVMLYLVPLLLFFAGYLIGAAVCSRGVLTGCMGLALGIVIAVLYDRKALRYQKTVYTITGYPTATMWESYTKGDENLD